MKFTNNPFHSMSNEVVFDLHAGDAISALKQGIDHEVNDFVNLELTAEQMLSNEAMLVREYVAYDVAHFLRDIKEGLYEWEAAAGCVLLSAADPTRVDWQRNRWWNEESRNL